MLDRMKLQAQLAHHASSLFKDFSHELLFAYEAFKKIGENEQIQEKIKLYSQCLPLWQGSISSVFPINTSLTDYQVVSVDGSQIYPDRHQGRSCYLINIGAIEISYRKMGSSISRDSEPYVMYIEGEEEDDSIDHVNCKRSEYELIESFRQSKKTLSKNVEFPFACLVDGSLIFWHLQSKSVEIKSRYFTSSLAILQQFYESRIPIVGYISLPKSKELIQLIHFAAEHNIISKSASIITHLVDADVMSNLPQGTRSPLFEHRSQLTNQYPAPIRPWFFYLNTGYEVARIEIPAWLTVEEELLEKTISIILNQVEKGHGYPVVLSEAHDVAVVKGHDRDFFYRLLEKFTHAHKQRYIISQKSLKKRRMHI